MRHNILGGLVIFVVVVTCLLLLDDISQQELTTVQTIENVELDQNQNSTDLAVIEIEE
jgi:hypothetical protein